MKVSIKIKRDKVMGVVEGISVIISQKNGGTPTFEQLWASEDERGKLDIYYREAVSDLERRLMEWLSESSSQYDLEADGEDYTLTMKMPRYWPSRLKGLLANKVQDYLVHSITAGWLNDFDGVTTKQDYTEMAGNDLADIREVVMQKDFGFSDAQRGSDGTKEQDETDIKTGARGADADKSHAGTTDEAGERGADTGKEAPERVSPTGERAEDAAKGDQSQATEAGKRRGDQYKSHAGTTDVSTKQRGADGEHKRTEWRPGTRRRTGDDDKDMPEGATPTGARGADTDKAEAETATKAGERGTDADKDMNEPATDAGERNSDKGKDTNRRATDAGERREDDEAFADEDKSIRAGERHEDNARVCHGSDWTDWSGTHFDPRWPRHKKGGPRW